MDLIKIERVNDCNVVDSRLIALELGISHSQFYRTIKDNETDIEQDFGHLCFKNESVQNSVGAVNKVKFAYLNEEQATYLMALSQNNPKVKLLKRRLVKSFSEAKKALATQIKAPQTYIEALKALVASEEEKERLAIEKEQLETENEKLAEAVDELFDYSSIIRIAKYNNCSEKNFKWRVLKGYSEKMNLEIKKVPCPRFGEKNLYSHDVWRVAYPEYKLPETTTLIIKK